MGEAASEDQEILGRLRKRSPHPDLHRNHLILPGSHCSSQDETQDIGLQHAPSSGNLTHSQTPHLSKISSTNKSNLNIDKELDGFYEPTLFDD